MSNNVTYSFVNETQTNSSTLVFRSTVNSYGFNHVTDKDLSSFYANFSALSYFDTGLLPVDGTGMLSIRSAGPHTQIAFQHAPGMYYINWGSYEGDPDAQKIYVAQPYRIVIADIYNNNLLGARTFYSPYAITHPNAQLYHVNLPNINCRGYRGNSVGWICLYHNEDISSYPFNEKVAKIIDRCSGTESYNDQNMSETDGPRFYQSYDKPSYLWDPGKWQNYSEQNGFAWTLDPDLWIPVLVQDIDNQGKHVDDGEPLTFLMAITGDYQCYYTDPIRPKPINALTRSDLTLNSDTIFNWFKQSYNISSLNPHNNNPFIDSLKVRDADSLKTSTPIQQNHGGHDIDDEEEDEGNYFLCARCEEKSHVDDAVRVLGDDLFCTYCVENYCAWVEHIDEYVEHDNPYLTYSTYTDNYYHLGFWTHFRNCLNCGRHHPYDPDNHFFSHQVNIWEHRVTDGDVTYLTEVCSYCIQSFVEGTSPGTFKKDPSLEYTYSACKHCSVYVPYNPSLSLSNYFDVPIYKDHNIDKVLSCCNTCYYNILSATDINTTYDYNHLYCICGEETSLDDMREAGHMLTSFNSTSPILSTLLQTKLFVGLDVYSSDQMETIVNKCYLHSTAQTILDEEFNIPEQSLLTVLAKISHLCSTCYESILGNSQNQKAYLSSVVDKLESFSHHTELYNSIYGLSLSFSKS